VTSKLERQRERFEADPSDRRAFEALEEQYFLSGAWEALTGLYERRLTAPDLEADPGARAQVLLRLGQVWQGEGGDLDRAAECFSRAVRSDPTFRPALQQLRRLQMERKQWAIAVQIAEMEIELPMPAPERAKLLAETGSIWLERLDDPEQAMELLERSLEIAPDQPAILPAAARAFRACGRDADAHATWSRAVEQLRGRERVEGLVAMAQLAAGPLGEPERAIELYRRVLTEDPQNGEAVEALASHAAARQQWPLLADLQERRFEAADTPERRVAIAIEAGRIERDHLCNPATARAWYDRASALAPDRIEIHEALSDLERDAGDEAKLLVRLERMIEIAGDAVRASTLMEAASLQTAAGRDERAAEHLRAALERAPDDGLIVEALSDTLARLGRDDERVDLLERRAVLAGADAPGRAALLTDLGFLYEDRLLDLDAAREAFERAYQAEPSDSRADALERLHRKLEDWPRLRALLERSAGEGDTDRRVRTLCSLGELLRTHFDDDAGAMRAFESALDLDARALVAHRGLQELAEANGDAEARIRSFGREAEVTSDRTRLAFLADELVRMLEEAGRLDEALVWALRRAEVSPDDPGPVRACARLHEELGHDAELVASLERLDPLLESVDRAANRRRLGEHHATRGRLDEAVEAYRSALEIEPEDRVALERLAAHLEETERWAELAPVWAWLAELLPDRSRMGCLDDLARLQAEKLSDPNAALDTLLRLSDEKEPPADLEPRLEALLEETGRIEELERRLARRLHALPEGAPDRFPLALRRAQLLLDRLGQAAEAAAAFRQALAEDPASREAIQGLERALRQGGDRRALAGFLDERARHAERPADRQWAALERAELLEDDLDDADAARSAYETLVGEAMDPELRARAARRLEALLERKRAWGALRQHLEAWPADESDGGAAAHHERIAHLCRDRLGDPSGAIAHLEEAARLDPERMEIWRELQVLHDAAGHHEALARAVEAELALETDPDRQRTLRSRAAALWAGPLDQPDRARPHYEALLELDPAHPAAAEFLIDQWERDGRYSAVVRLLELRLDGLDALPLEAEAEWKARRTSLRLRIAGLCAGPLDDVDGAIAALEPALAEIGPQAVIAEPLADLYRRAGYTDDFVALCQRAAPACQDASERANWQIRLGDALRGRDDRAAADAYRSALSDRPGDRATQASLRELYRALDEVEPLVHLLEAELSHLAGVGEIPARMELAGLLEDRLARPAEALVHLRRVLQIETAHPEALERALSLADRLSAEQEPEGDGELSALVVDLIDTGLARARGPRGRAALLARRGRLLARLPGRAEEGALAYREAIALDSEARPMLRGELRQLLERQGRWDAVLDCIYEDACEASGAEREALFERGAGLAAAHFDRDASLPWLERLRRLRPDDPEIPRRVADVHRAAGRHEAVLRCIEDEVERTDDPVRRRELRIEQARLLEEALHAPARAAAVLELALEDTPGHRDVLERLDRLYRAAGRPRERAAVLEALIEDAPPEEKLSLVCEAASLFTGALSDPVNAVRHLLIAVQATPQGSGMQAELLRTLGGALEAAALPEAWARCAEHELRGLDPDAPVFAERRRELHRRLARCYEEVLGRPDAALSHLWALIEHPSGDESPGDLDEIESGLLRLLRAEGNWVELEGRLAAHLERRPDDAEGWLELARLRDEHLHARRGAADAYRRVMAIEPGCLPAIRGLRGASERLGDWKHVAMTLEAELEHVPPDTGEGRAALLRRLGDVCWEHLHSTTRASRSYARALEADGEDLESLRSLERLLEAMEDWRGALDLYESEVEVLGDREPERRKEIWLRVGSLARDRTGEIERARRGYMAASELGALDLEQRGELAELHERCGDIGGFVEIYADWCDDPGSGAGVSQHARLAEALADVDRLDEALKRIERAIECDADFAPAWDVAARLREQGGDSSGAAEALCRAADALGDDEAATRLLQAADLRAEDDPEAAALLLRAATARDPGSLEAHERLALLAWRLGLAEETEEAARHALDLSGEDGRTLPPERKLPIALAGGRAAESRQRSASAGTFFSEVLSLEPEHAEALAGYGSALAAERDLAGAARVLEVRVDMGDAYPERAAHLAILGEHHEIEGRNDDAVARYEQALAIDGRLDGAHARLVHIHESAGDLEAGVAALERWADAAQEPSDRTERLLRATAWEMREGGHEESAERHLREVLETDPASAHTWQALAGLLWERGRVDEALDVATRALDGLRDEAAQAPLALVRARALEHKGERREAADAYVLVANRDPRCSEAALAGARLLRGLGEWRAAADTLESFAARNPGDDPSSLAEVLHQLARLLAGPLEDVEQAIAHYRRAIGLTPERRDVRTALAELLSHRPDDWQEALRHHRALIEDDPADPDALRMLLRITRGREQAAGESGGAALATGLCLLRALGLLSPRDREEADAIRSLSFVDSETLEDPIYESLRRLANEASEEIAEALGASGAASAEPDAGEHSDFRSTALAVEARLTAPALIPLSAEEAGEVLTLVAAVCLEPEQVRGEGRLLNGVSTAISRRSRRRLRRLLEEVPLESIEAVEFDVWRLEVRSLAAAIALDETGVDLRDALLDEIRSEVEPPPADLSDEAELCALVRHAPRALGLVHLAVRTWLARL